MSLHFVTVMPGEKHSASVVSVVKRNQASDHQVVWPGRHLWVAGDNTHTQVPKTISLPHTRLSFFHFRKHVFLGPLVLGLNSDKI